MKYSIIRTDKADEGIRHTVLYLANHFGNEFALEKLDYIVNTIFPIKVEVGAIKQKGSQVKCSLKQNDQVIARQILTIGQDYFFQEVSFEVEAPKKGILRYSVELEIDRLERT